VFWTTGRHRRQYELVTCMRPGYDQPESGSDNPGEGG
jgi:hypothetical protein